MPRTIGDVPAPPRQRAHTERLTQAMERSIASLGKSRVSVAEPATVAAEKPVFLADRPTDGGLAARPRHKPLLARQSAHVDRAKSDRVQLDPAKAGGAKRRDAKAPDAKARDAKARDPRAEHALLRWANSGGASAHRRPSEDKPRTPQELANLAARRALRDEMVEAFGEEMAGAAFAHLGVALKGKGKFAALDEPTQHAVWRYVPERTAQAHEVALQALAQSWPGGLSGLARSTDFALFTAFLRTQVEAHPHYGKAALSKAQAFQIAQRVERAVEAHKWHLMSAASLAQFLEPQMGHDRYGLPLSFDQAVADYQASHRQYVRATPADIAAMKDKLRAFTNLDAILFRYEADRYIEAEYPKFSHEKRAWITAQCGLAYAGLRALMPRELAGLIASTMWAFFQREISH